MWNKETRKWEKDKPRKSFWSFQSFIIASCNVVVLSVLFIYIIIYIYILFFYMQVAIHSIIFIPFRGKDWYSLPEEAAEAWSTKKSKNIHVCTQYV